MQLRIPVTEGERYRVGEVKFEGNKVVNTKFLQPLFKMKTGEWYSEKNVRKGFEKAREVYGGGGYFEFTGYPGHAVRRSRPRARSRVRREPTVNVTMRLQEGEQYFVNRITFTGNTTTRDNVIRREMRLVEGGVFSTEALKYSIRRLNQLGYFQNLEQSPDAVDVAEDAAVEERGRRHAEAGGAEPQPAHVRRRRVAVRGLLRPAVVPDLELPRPRRVAHPVAAGRLARRELPGRVHRAVPVRPQHHRRRRRLQAQPPVHQPVHAEVDRRQPPVRVPGRRLLADVHDLQLGTRQRRRGVRPTSRNAARYSGSAQLPDAARTTRSCRIRCSSARAASAPSARSRRASSSTPSTTRSSRPPAAACRCRAISPAWAATPTSSSRALEAVGILPPHQRGRRSASAARSSTSGRMAARVVLPIFERLFLGGEYSIRGFDIRIDRSARSRSRSSCSAATRACCSTPNT